MSARPLKSVPAFRPTRRRAPSATSRKASRRWSCAFINLPEAPGMGCVLDEGRLRATRSAARAW